MKALTVCGLLLALSAPAFGQAVDFQQLLSGKEVPQNVKLKDLNSDWRRLTITTTDGAKGGSGDMMSQLMPMAMMSEMGKGGKGGDPMAAMLGMTMLGGMMGGGSQQPVYYTKGQTVTVASESFLVAYKYEKPQMNFMELAMQGDKAGGKEPDFAKLMSEGKMTSDSPLTLALINVKTIGTLSGIRPFDLEREIADSEKAGGGGLMDLFMLGSRNTTQQAEEKPAVTIKKPATKPKGK
jgi:hypothetical protein